jgi:mono/diheme cytochrome c family protein
MPRNIGVLALLGLAIALGACRSTESGKAPAPSPDPVLAELGRDVFVRRCASCHGESGQGDGPAAGALRTPPADLTRIAARRGGVFPKGEIARFIDGRFAVAAHGTREMPIWGQRLGEQIPEADVSEEVVRGQISVLIEYLASIQRGE